jgi:hypothetical protein
LKLAYTASRLCNREEVFSTTSGKDGSVIHNNNHKSVIQIHEIKMYYSFGVITISFKLPNRWLELPSNEARARRTTKSYLMREFPKKYLPNKTYLENMPVLPPGESVYDYALLIFEAGMGAAWMRCKRSGRQFQIHGWFWQITVIATSLV